MLGLQKKLEPLVPFPVFDRKKTCLHMRHSREEGLFCTSYVRSVKLCVQSLCLVEYIIPLSGPTTVIKILILRKSSIVSPKDCGDTSNYQHAGQKLL